MPTASCWLDPPPGQSLKCALPAGERTLCSCRAVSATVGSTVPVGPPGMASGSAGYVCVHGGDTPGGTCSGTGRGRAAVRGPCAAWRRPVPARPGCGSPQLPGPAVFVVCVRTVRAGRKCPSPDLLRAQHHVPVWLPFPRTEKVNDGLTEVRLRVPAGDRGVRGGCCRRLRAVPGGWRVLPLVRGRSSPESRRQSSSQCPSAASCLHQRDRCLHGRVHTHIPTDFVI